MKLARAVAAALVAVSVTGCGGGTDAGNEARGEATGEATATPSRPPAGQTGGATGSGTVLQATVGSEDDPDAYEIVLTDASGEVVEQLAPGTYTIEVRDLSRIHNFHLLGPGVDEATSVPEVEDVTFTVTLGEGDYRYLCDPHPTMRGDVAVA